MTHLDKGSDTGGQTLSPASLTQPTFHAHQASGVYSLCSALYHYQGWGDQNLSLDSCAQSSLDCTLGMEGDKMLFIWNNT